MGVDPAGEMELSFPKEFSRRRVSPVIANLSGSDNRMSIRYWSKQGGTAEVSFVPGDGGFFV